MKITHSITKLILLAVLLTSASCRSVDESRAERLGFDPKRLESVSDVLREQVADKKIAGGVVLVARKGEVVLQHAVGYLDAERYIPMRTDSIFRIASMTKPITSVLAMMLVEDGTLSLDDPISGLFPEFARPELLVRSQPKEGQTPHYGMVPTLTQITVRHLLTHTSGLSYRFFAHEYLGPNYEKNGVSDGLVETPGTAGDNARRIAKSPLLFTPGKGWEYSLSTDVLGAVLEKASGKSLDALFRERIFEPLAMNDTHFVVPKLKRGRLTTVYASSKDDSFTPLPTDKPVVNGLLVYSQTYPYKSDGTYFSGGAGLVSTAHDYFRFTQMLLNGGVLDGVRVLKTETVEQMRTNQVGELDPVLSRVAQHGAHFGFGFGIVSEQERGKGLGAPGSFGWGGFFNTYFWIDPDQELIGVLMTQLHPNDHLEIRADFRARVYDALRYALLTN